MLSESCSLSNFAEWTPITANGSSLYLSSKCLRSGNTWRQLTQQYVQKSSSSSFPLSSFDTLSALPVLNHSRFCGNWTSDKPPGDRSTLSRYSKMSCSDMSEKSTCPEALFKMPLRFAYRNRRVRDITEPTNNQPSATTAHLAKSRLSVGLSCLKSRPEEHSMVFVKIVLILVHGRKIRRLFSGLNTRRPRDANSLFARARFGATQYACAFAK
mmetsp:Transcript_43720/g.71068  ORF Transcript_43720/g.71068 Transcript_43720/m.71068 type:complete len:213 (-) Transcript_43720:98-736(-)